MDRLFDAQGEIARWEDRRIDTEHTHGTGCTLASAIATGMAQGMALTDAIGRARQYVRAALLAAPGLGGGHGPIDRKSVVSGQSVSVRVDLGGRRIIKKKKKST